MASSASAGTKLLFSADPQTSFTIGPFPSNSATTADNTQLTGLRIDLPATEDTCNDSPTSVCGSNGLLNQLDGFSVNPRLTVCFSGPVQTSSLRFGLSLQPLSGGRAIGVNQIVYDNRTNCVFAKPESVLAQQSSYLLIATTALVDTNHQAVEADPAFLQCRNAGEGYCDALNDALVRNGWANTPSSCVVAASLFTTLSATHWLEQVRKEIDFFPLYSNFPAGFPSSFPLNLLQSINWMPSQGTLSGPQPLPLTSLTGVSSIAFGIFLSPNYIATSGPAAGTIPQTPTALPPAFPNAVLPVSYHVFLPPSSPGSKIPVVIYGHGLSDSQFGAPTYIASTLAQHGFATLALEITGHGYGQSSFVNVTDTSGRNFYEWTPGRGVQLAPGQPIGAIDGCVAPGAVAIRDCARQTAVDLFALVKTIRATGGLGMNLDPERIYYIGQSLGATYGTIFHATEPAVRTAVINAGGGTSIDVARLSTTDLPLELSYLNSVDPSLLADSPPGAVVDSYPFRDQITVPAKGAVPIQAAFEAADWLGMPGDPLAFAPHLRKRAHLSGVPHKSTLFQFGYGDLEVPNPTESALIRAADAFGSTTFLHFETAVSIDPGLLTVGTAATEFGFPVLPHRILSNPTLAEPVNVSERSISYALQDQAADFFASNGRVIADPNAFLKTPFVGVPLFEIITSPRQLPERLNFLVGP